MDRAAAVATAAAVAAATAAAAGKLLVFAVMPCRPQPRRAFFRSYGYDSVLMSIYDL